MGAPNTIANLVYWVKSDAGVFTDLAKTTPATNGTTVACWADQVASTDFTQATAGLRPTFQTNQINGLPALTFNGKALAAVHANFAQPYTLVYVFNPTSLPNAFNVIYDGAANSPQTSFAGTNPATTPYLFAGSVSNAVRAIPFNAFNYHVAFFSGDSSYLRVDNIGIEAGGGGNPGTGGVQNTILCNNLASGGTQYIAGQMAEFMLYSRKLTAAELASLDTYFRARYGFANTLVNVNNPRVATPCVVGYLKGVSIGPTAYYGDSPNGRHMQVGIRRDTTAGYLGSDALALDIPGFWRFRWQVDSGRANTVSILAKQVSNVTGKRPSMIVRKNTAIGVNADVSGSAPSGTGLVTIGPLSVTPSSKGVLDVELWNNDTDTFNSPAFFDHLIFT